MSRGDLTAALTELEYEELLVLRWYVRNSPDDMTDAAWGRFGELEEQSRRYQDEQWVAHTKQWTKGLTRRKLRAIERKSKSGEDLTYEEMQQWAAAVNRTRPSSAASDDEWDAWYAQDVTVSMFGHTDCSWLRAAGASRQVTRRRPVRRTVRLATHGSPGRPRPSSGDDDPHHDDVDPLVEAVAA